MINFTCEICGKQFKVYPADVRKGGGRCCSVLCRNRRLAAAHERPWLERFWEKVNKTDTCWLWTGGTTQDGYGMLGRDGANVRANRLSWEIHHGSVPDGRHVLHHCDNPSCVNPDHLFLGTDAGNKADSIAKDRHARGERQGFAKLTDALVLEIRRRYAAGGVTHRGLAAEYKVTFATIRNVVVGISWKHLPLTPGLASQST